MSEISEAFQNLTLYPVTVEASKEYTSYYPDIEQPVEFKVPPLSKPKQKKRTYVGWRKIRKKKPAKKLPKINNPLKKGKEVTTGESSNLQEMETGDKNKKIEIPMEEITKEVVMEVGQGSIPAQREIGESSNPTQERTFQDEIDFLLASCETIQPVNNNNNNIFNYSLGNQLPMNWEPAIPDPIVHSQPIGMDEWWTNDWQFQNIVNDPYSFLPQFDPEPLPNPPMSNENMAELRHFGEELFDAGTRIREIGGQIAWKYDEREMRF